MSMMEFDAFKMAIGLPEKIPADAGDLSFRPFLCGNDLLVLLGIIHKFRPKIFVEFGLNTGKTAKAILDSSPWIEKYLGIDVFPGFSTIMASQRSEVPLEAGKFVENDKRVERIITANGSVDITPEMIAGIDGAFIDADHSYEGVKRDTELAEKSMVNGGVIAWHDYTTPNMEVKRFIDERNHFGGNRVCLVQGSNICFEVIRPRS